MKQIISFSLDEGTMKKLDEKMKKNSNFRNKSHLVECALEKFLLETGEKK